MKLQLKSTELKSLAQLPKDKLICLKHWQQNDYYPIEFINKVENGWEHYNIKSTGRKAGYSIWTDEFLFGYLVLNLFLITDYEMKDNKHFNYE